MIRAGCDRVCLGVRVGGKRVKEGVDGWGVPTGGVECEVYPTDMGRHSVPEAEK